jgi:hypothetical protein
VASAQWISTRPGYKTSRKAPGRHDGSDIFPGVIAAFGVIARLESALDRPVKPGDDNRM